MIATALPAPSDGGQQNEALRRTLGRPLPVPGTPSAPAARSLAEQLSAVAGHLTRHRPTDPMTEAARMTLALRTAGTAAASRPLLRLLPWPATAGITRGEYALRLHRIAYSIGGAQ